MARRIGNYINPETQEQDWIEPETINDNIKFVPKRVTRIGEAFDTNIEFKISYVDPEPHVRFWAEYTTELRTFTSDVIEIDLEVFGEELAMIVYAGKSLDEAKLFIDAKERALNDLTFKLFDQNIILGDVEAQGIGFVIVNDLKVMTIDALSLHYDASAENPYQATLKDCVGLVSLRNVEGDKHIVFHNGTHTLSLTNPRVIDGQEGMTSTYNVSVNDINVVTDATEIVAIPERPSDEEQFIESRISMLDSLTNDTSDIDRQFGDLF